ncbi:hypothetical protein ARAF_0667 [Arsenophonus endosymbiont of Aleurodicus floccissimus]|nr:hypothetical protein ARAF_0667 [Arsenophonus endosymbiont of Aleurodicus floccissimus]
MCIDVQLAKSALTAVENEQKRLSTVTPQLTGNTVQSTTQRDALLQHNYLGIWHHITGYASQHATAPH